MSKTLTIRNLDEEVKRRLRLRAASHQRSMEAEARAILAASVMGDTDQGELDIERRRRVEAAVGIWKERYEGKSTDEVMMELRGDD